MAGIGTAARNYWEEEEKKGIGTAATRVPGDGQGQGIGTAATRVPGQNISQPDQGIGTAATRQPGQVEYAASPTQQQPIQVMRGVTPGTQQKLNGLQTGYQPTTAAQAAQQALQSIQAQKPQGYNSQYAPQLQSILQQIQGQKDFKYEVNSDPFFRINGHYGLDGPDGRFHENVRCAAGIPYSAWLLEKTKFSAIVSGKRKRKVL